MNFCEDCGHEGVTRWNGEDGDLHFTCTKHTPSDVKASVPFGTRVKLGTDNVTKESQGKTGTVIDPKITGDAWMIQAIETNPHFNVVKMDDATMGNGRGVIWMTDNQLEVA